MLGNLLFLPTILVFQFLSIFLFIPSSSQKPVFQNSISQQHSNQANLKLNGDKVVYQSRRISVAGKSASYASSNLEALIWPETTIIKSMKVSLGGPLGAKLHHAVAFNTNVPDAVCQNFGGELFFAAGTELTPIDIKEGYGYLIKKGDRIIVDSHFINPTDKNLDNIFLNFEFYTDKNITRFTPIKPLFISEPNCVEEPSFPVPIVSGDFEKDLSAPVRSQYQGRIIQVGGHLHQWGKSLKLFKNDKLLLEFKPKLASDGEVLAFTPIKDIDIEIKKGDKLFTKATYTNPTGKIIDGMSIVMLMIKTTN